ncbi:hypothetical protein EV183_005325 [Coemansia sp. RSA 2336]|nr:hypothetical protein EV183_005325 [Coemansia sp. RSA 2336]
MRIFVVPITRARWALHCHPVNIVPTRMTKWAATASEKWSKWAVYPKNTWRGRIYTYGESLMDRIDFREYFLKEIPTKSEGAMLSKVDVVAPSILGKAEVLKELRALAQKQIPYHSKWMKICCYMLPVSSLFTLVPLIPNFPFFYNLFRVYSHYKARHGAQHLLHLLDEGTYEVVIDSELSRWYQGASSSAGSSADSQTIDETRSPGYSSIQRSPVTSDDQRTLENGCPLLEDPVLISDNDISRMATYFQLSSFEPAIRRARHQIVADLTKASS